MAGPAGPRHHRPMNTFFGKGDLVMTTEAERSEVFAVFQEKTAVGSVGPVTGQTLAVRDRLMGKRPLTGGFMTGSTKFLALRNQ